MNIGIQICGLNGCGKSTIGKALAEEVGFHFIDNENQQYNKVRTNNQKRKLDIYNIEYNWRP